MNVKHELANLFKNTIEQIYILDSKHTKNVEFKDSRRVKIYSSVELTDEQKTAVDKLYLENYGKKYLIHGIDIIWLSPATLMQATSQT